VSSTPATRGIGISGDDHTAVGEGMHDNEFQRGSVPNLSKATAFATGSHAPTAL